MAFSLVPLTALAVEDTGDSLQYEESEEDPGLPESVQQESESDDADETDSSDESTDVIEDGEDETSFVNPSEDENSKEPQNEEEKTEEIELLDEKQEETDEAEWTELSSVSLQYDDRYSLEDLLETSGITEEYAISDIIGTPVSYQVVNGSKTGSLDESVITQESEDSLDVIATGIGTAAVYLIPANQEVTDETTGSTDQREGTESTEDPELTDDSDQTDEPEPVEDGLKVEVTVEPATLTLMYLTGQSNMEGQCSSSTGYELDASIACEEGTVYSTYAPTNSISNSITKLTFGSYCDKDNAEDFVAGSLQSNTSISGEDLTYSLDTLTTKGTGKTGPDSGLAYEWNRLTGDKVWVINTSWSGTNIASWQPGSGSLYIRSEAVWDCVDQVYQAETDAGHYTKGSRLAFWLQGETGDKTKAAADYKSDFSNMYTAMKSTLGLDAMGIIMVRASTGSYTTDDEWEMTGPRIAQYILGGSAGLSGVYVVSNVNEQWVTDAGVKSYFQSAYGGSSLTYPIRNSSKASLPTTVKEVHSDIHYSQIGHNENGITAAYGMYQALAGTESPTGFEWRGEDGKAVTSLTMTYTGDTAFALPIVEPVYTAKKVSYSVSGNAAAYDSSSGIVTATASKNYETSDLIASYNGNKSKVSVTVMTTTDLTSIVGKDYTGIYHDESADVWWYLKNGIIQTKYEGVEQNEYGWWYINNGKVDFSYTGFAENKYGWWYIEKGKVIFSTNSVIQDTNKKIDGTNGWYYVVGGQVQTGYTGVANYSNSSGWWYVKKGKVDFSANTVAKNDYGWWYVLNGKVQFGFSGLANYSNDYGWWYIKDGKVDFSVNTVAQNNYGWWYIKGGKVDFSANTVAQNNYGWWYVTGGKVQFGYTGVGNYSNAYGWWYIKGGKVDFSVNTVAQNTYGWWYVKNGKVDFSFNGIASNAYGSWYIQGGKVNFSYNGTCAYNGIRYTIVNGKVQNR